MLGSLSLLSAICTPTRNSWSVHRLAKAHYFTFHAKSSGVILLSIRCRRTTRPSGTWRCILQHFRQYPRFAMFACRSNLLQYRHRTPNESGERIGGAAGVCVLVSVITSGAFAPIRSPLCSEEVRMDFCCSLP